MEASACPDEYEHTIPGVMYIVNNIPGSGIDIEDFESVYSVGCSCTSHCTDCSCTRGFPNYINGVLAEKLSGPIVECNSCCTCKKDCGNRVVQNGPLNSLKVSEVGEKGFGLFTGKLIKRGQFICEYAGEVISIEEARHRVEANKNSMNYVLVVSEHIGDQTIVTCIDPKYFGNIGRYANHSCEPNANLLPVRIEGTTPRLCLFASRDIQVGEEVTFSYADGIANSARTFSKTRCLCGSSNCVGYLPHNTI